MNTPSFSNPPARTRTSWIVAVALAALTASVLAILLPSEPANAADGCSTTLSPGSNVASVIASAANGSTICLEDGNYGNLTVTARRGGFVTVVSENPRKAVFGSISIRDASYVRFEQIKVTGTFGNGEDDSHHIEIAGSDLRTVLIDGVAKSRETRGASDWLIEYNTIHDCPGFCVALLSADPVKYHPISNVTIRGNKMGPMAGGQDAIRVHNWRNVSITDNEIFGVIEDGQHNDCLQSVWGGSGMVFARNYLHDNNCQTFFLKDGHTSNVVFENNLSLRNRNGSAPVVGKIYPTDGFTMRYNTLWDISGFNLRSRPHRAPFPTGGASDYVVTNNVIVNWVPYDDATKDAGVFATSDLLVEDYNVFGGGWTWVPNNMGPHSVLDESPDFVRTSSSATQDFSQGDWRLRSKVSKGGETYSAGITWKLWGRLFGIAAWDGGELEPGGDLPPPPAQSGRFVDDDGNTHEKAIEAIAEKGITLGCNPPANTRFCPSSVVTRAQMAGFLARALSLPAASQDYFSDDNGSVFERDINRLAAAGITLGCNPPANDRYCPDAPMTRGSAATMISRAFDYPYVNADSFVDDDGSVFEEDIERLAAEGVTVGCNPPANTRFCPDQELRRDVFASLIARALRLI